MSKNKYFHCEVCNEPIYRYGFIINNTNLCNRCMQERYRVNFADKLNDDISRFCNWYQGYVDGDQKHHSCNCPEVDGDCIGSACSHFVSDTIY